MSRPKNWRTSDAGPRRALDDVRLVEWRNAEAFRREKAAWLRAIRRVGDLRLTNMVVVVLVISDFMRPENDAAWPSINRLAAELGWSVASVKRALRLAVAWGWLIRDRRYATSNRYLMSFSVSVRTGVEERHGLRIAPFLDRQGSRIKPEPTDSSSLISLSDQTCAHSGIKPDPRYLGRIPENDTGEEFLTERLGETEQDEALQEPSLSIETFHALLGFGDADLGEWRGMRLGSQRVAFLMSQIEEYGAVGAAEQIHEAAAIADAAEVAAQSSNIRRAEK
jgi:hypothetical protein